MAEKAAVDGRNEENRSGRFVPGGDGVAVITREASIPCTLVVTGTLARVKTGSERRRSRLWHVFT